MVHHERDLRIYGVRHCARLEIYRNLNNRRGLRINSSMKEEMLTIKSFEQSRRDNVFDSNKMFWRGSCIVNSALQEIIAENGAIVISTKLD